MVRGIYTVCLRACAASGTVAMWAAAYSASEKSVGIGWVVGQETPLELAAGPTLRGSLERVGGLVRA